MIKKFFVKTLGCKVNQVESSFIIEKLKDKGLIFSSEKDAQLLILNSCIVTAKAEAECRKIVKKWNQKNPELIVIAGCYAQKFPEKISIWAKEQGVSNLIILGQKEKLEIYKLLDKFLKTHHIDYPIIMVSPLHELKDLKCIILHNFFNHSRAFVKVQDGCDNFCSYCIVPYTRGAPRSCSIQEILTQIKVFIDQGFEEIVLTGINLGKWGKELKPPQKLPDLLREIENFLNSYKKSFILRLSSLEVTEIKENFINFAKISKFLAPHFHIPLQSGSNKILKLMNRSYTKEQYIQTLEKLYQIFPQATFGADVIVGFPGETEEDFISTYEVVKYSPLNWLHIFPFSSRPGTFAEKLPDKIPAKIIKNRVKSLKELFFEKRKNFLKSEIGKTRKVILEKFDETKNMWKGLSENYISVWVKSKNKELELKRKIVKVKFVELHENYVIGDFITDL